MEVAYLPGSLGDALKEFTVAALCHDIGHTAFSHVFEPLFLPEGYTKHDQWTVELLQTDMNDKISDYCDFEAVLQMFDGSHNMQALCTLISGVLDVDRCDYLMRDSIFSGVRYGHYDLLWLIHAMSLTKGAYDLPYLILDGPRGLDSFKQYIQARRSMHRQVYYHATIRAAQKLLRAIFERAQDASDQLRRSDVQPALHCIIFEKKRPSTSDFMRTNNFSVMSTIYDFAYSAADPVLKHLSASFVGRDLPKVIYDSSQFAPGQHICTDERSAASLVQRLQERLMDRLGSSFPGGKDAVRYSVFLDDIYFDPIPLANVYFHMRGKSYTLDELQDWGGDFDLGELAKPFQIYRIFVPQEARSEGRAYLREELQR